LLLISYSKTRLAHTHTHTHRQVFSALSSGVYGDDKHVLKGSGVREDLLLSCVSRHFPVLSLICGVMRTLMDEVWGARQPKSSKRAVRRTPGAAPG